MGTLNVFYSIYVFIDPFAKYVPLRALGKCKMLQGFSCMILVLVISNCEHFGTRRQSFMA